MLLHGQTGSANELNSWYLCSTVGCLQEGGQTGGPANRGPTGSPDEPLYRSEVSMHAVYGAMARQLSS